MSIGKPQESPSLGDQTEVEDDLTGTVRTPEELAQQKDDDSNVDGFRLGKKPEPQANMNLLNFLFIIIYKYMLKHGISYQLVSRCGLYVFFFFSFF